MFLAHVILPVGADVGDLVVGEVLDEVVDFLLELGEGECRLGSFARRDC